MAQVSPDPNPDMEYAEKPAVIGAQTEAVVPTGAAAEVEEAKPEKTEPEYPPIGFGKLFSLAGPLDGLLLVMGFVGSIAAGAVNPGLIYYWGKMIDAAADAGPSMSDQLIGMSVIGGAGFIGCTFQVACLRIFAQRMANRLRNAYYEALLYKDVKFFDESVAASMAANMATDADKYMNAFGDKFGQGLSGAWGCIMSITLAFVLGWKLSLVTLAAVPMMTVGMVIMGTAVQEVAEETQSWYSQAAATVEECLFALRTVVAFGGERREISRYNTAVKQARAGAIKNVLRCSMGMGYIECVWACSNALALWYGMTLIYDGEINPETGKVYTGGDILIVFFALLTGGFLLGQLEPAFKALEQGKVAAARFFAILETPSTIQCAGKDTRKQLTTFESFEFRDVTFTYPARPDVPVLKGLTFKIEAGQKVAFVGESGSGKSTVMALLDRFYDPSGGFVMVNGEDMKGFAPSSLRALIGYVGQEPVLFATSVRSNIMQGWPDATEEDFKTATSAANLAFIDELPDKYNTFVGSGGSQFSGGQKQRIAIARALLRKPKVLFLDEATSALDGNSERMIQETIESLDKNGIGGQTLTTVSIAHRLTTIRNCDVIFALKDGVVVESGNHEALMEKKGIYYGLAAVQMAAGPQEPAAAADAAEMAVVKKPSDSSVNSNPIEVADASKPDGKGAAAAGRADVDVALDADKKEEERQQAIAKTYATPYGRLMQYNKPEWPWFVPGILGAIAHGANNPIQGYLLVRVLDDLYSPDKDQMRESVVMLSLYLCLLGVMVFCASLAHGVAFGFLSEGMTMRLRVAILTHVFRQEVGWHDNPEHTPALVGTALQLWSYRVTAMNSTIEVLCNVASSLTIGLIIAFVGCWQMSLAMLGAIPVLVISGAVQMIFMLGGSSLANAKLKIAMQIVGDSVQNARTVQACGMESALVKYHSQLTLEACKGYIWRSIGGGLAFGFSTATPNFIMVFGMWYADVLIQDGTADFNGVMMAFMGILYAAMGAGQASATMGDTAKAKVACHDMFKLLDTQSKIDGLEPTGKTPSWPVVDGMVAEAGNIEFKDVKFSYPFRPDVQVLKGVSFQIKAGQSVGLVGPSGGGKSTVMALLQRFYDPDEGTVCVGTEGMPLKDINIRWWRKQIGFVGQEPLLFDTTVKENVLYGLDTQAGETISDEQLEKYKRMSHLDFIDTDQNQGWDTKVGPRGGRLSGGQKQRVAICRALVRNPPVLLLDEATSALDTESERVVQEALELARQGRTSIAIAHRLTTVKDCDMILVAGEGVILESGTHTELTELKGVYFKLQGSTH